MGPKTFVACYVCLREFGSRSISFHETKCLERWRTAAKKQPPEKRAPTPVKPAEWKHNCTATWFCTNCQKSIPTSKQSEHSAGCSKKDTKPEPLLDATKQNGASHVDANKTETTLKKGKENKNVPKKQVVPNQKRRATKKDASSDASCEVLKDVADKLGKDQVKPETVSASILRKESDVKGENDCSMDESSTSKRSVRPQTKILRRPTPNLRHPIIQVDSDDSGDGSDKSKEDNPKRLKTSNEGSGSEHKTKNFVMYNKYNVDKNTKNGSSKERKDPHAQQTIIPNPCNSCTRSIAPERLHSHRKGLAFRKSPQIDKVASPQKKLPDVREKSPKENISSEISIITPKDDEDNTNIEASVVVEPPRERIPDENEPIRKCYICQESFRISLLLMHESQCLQNWKTANNSLSPNQRKLPPRKPDNEDSHCLHSSDPAWTAVQSQLIPCTLCGRTFFPERLPVHQRVCKGKFSPRSLTRASSLREQSVTMNEEDKKAVVPLYVPCQICGRNYGSWVIPMHEAQCIRKRRKSSNELTECSNDEETFTTDKTISSSDVDIICTVELGDNAWQSHLQQLVPCPRCSRTFFPDRLEVHERSCKGQVTNRRPKSNNSGNT